MKAGQAILLVLLVAGFCPGVLRAESLPLFVERHDAQVSEKEGDYVGALARFKVELGLLEKVHQQAPDWEGDVVTKSMTDCRDSIIRLEPKALKQFEDKNKAAPNPDSGLGDLYNAALKEPNPLHAANMMVEYQTSLEFTQRIHPNWQPDIVLSQIKDAQRETNRLENEVIDKMEEHGANGHTIQ